MEWKNRKAVEIFFFSAFQALSRFRAPPTARHEPFSSPAEPCPERTFNTSAVSSTLSPPKKRSSMTLALRGSTSARAFNPPSSAIVSRARPDPTFGTSSRFTRGVAPPRPVQQNAPHDGRRYREEVGPVLPVHIGDVDQFQVGFVNQRRGLDYGAAGKLRPGAYDIAVTAPASRSCCGAELSYGR